MMAEVLYHPETNAISGAEHLVVGNGPRYVELLTNPTKHGDEWRALANVDGQLAVVVVSIHRKESED